LNRSIGAGPQPVQPFNASIVLYCYLRNSNILGKSLNRLSATPDRKLEGRAKLAKAAKESCDLANFASFAQLFSDRGELGFGCGLSRAGQMRVCQLRCCRGGSFPLPLRLLISTV
jgi:hypothetical protein